MIPQSYRIQFPVMRQYEADTFYDQRGRIVFTASKGLPGVGFTRPDWNAIKDMQTGTVTRTILDTTLPTGPIERVLEYVAPFTKNNREQDYQTVWAKMDANAVEGPPQSRASGGTAPPGAIALRQNVHPGSATETLRDPEARTCT